jgi:hypothetical protein
MAPHQQPAPLGRGHRNGPRQPWPGIPARPFGTIAGAHSCSAVLRQRGQKGFDLPWLPAEPDVCMARDRPPIRPRLGCQPQAQPSVIPVDAVAGAPAAGHTGRERPLPQVLGQLRCGRQPTILWDARRRQWVGSSAHALGRERSRASKAWPSRRA